MPLPLLNVLSRHKRTLLTSPPPTRQKLDLYVRNKKIPFLKNQKNVVTQSFKKNSKKHNASQTVHKNKYDHSCRSVKGTVKEKEEEEGKNQKQ